MTMLHDGRDLKISIRPPDRPVSNKPVYHLLFESGVITKLESAYFLCNVEAESICVAEQIALIIGRNFYDSGMDSSEYREYFNANREDIVNDA